MFLLQVPEHLRDDVHVALVHHAGADKAQIDLLLRAVVGDRSDRVVGILLGDVDIVDVRVGDHRLVDLIQIDDDLGEIFGVGVGRQRRVRARFDVRDPRVRLVDQPLQHLDIVVHALVNHDLDAGLCDLQGLDEGGVVGNADRRFCLHLGRPVREGEGLVGEQSADMDLDDPALEHIVAALIQHLRLGRMDHVAEIHVIGHFALEGNLDRLRDRHRRLAGRQGQRDRARVGAKRDPFGHPSVRIAADDDGPVVDRDIVQDLVDDVRHGMVDAFRVPSRDQAEIVHELHKLRRVRRRFRVPDRGRVTAGLVGAVDIRRQHRRGHGLQFLHRHRAGRVLRADDVDPHPDIGARMQHRVLGHPDGVLVEDLLDRGQALSGVGQFLRGREGGLELDPECVCREGLQLLAEHYGVGPSGLDELDTLRREGRGDVHQFFIACFIAEFLVFCVDGQNGARRDGIALLENGVAVIVQDRITVVIRLPSPVFQVDADAAGHAQCRHEDRGNTVRTRDDRRIVHERDVGAGRLAGP